MNEVALAIIALQLAIGNARRCAGERAPHDHALTALHVYPSQIALATSRDAQSVIVQAEYADGITRDVTDKVDVEARSRRPRHARGQPICSQGGWRREAHRHVRIDKRRCADQREAGGRRSADQLQARRDAGVHEGRLQLGKLPRLGPRQRRLSPVALRFRSGRRLLSPHARAARAAARSFDSQRVPAH